MALNLTKSSRNGLRGSDSTDRPAKRIKLLSDDEDADGGSSGESSGGVTLDSSKSAKKGSDFKINEEYARRFEHNQRRVELQRCELPSHLFYAKTNILVVEEKYGKSQTGDALIKSEENVQDEHNEDESTSDSEEEDDDGILASGVLDEQVNATLEAIRTKDPRVYDERATFYTSIDEDDHDNHVQGKKGSIKPIYLSDYHRQNLLRGSLEEGDEQEAAPTYTQEQDKLKKSIVEEMHAAAAAAGQISRSATGADNDSGEESDFLTTKLPTTNWRRKKSSVRPPVPVDLENADKDPEAFLSNFMSARAWVPTAGFHFQPFESDDDDEDERAEAFEEAYNLRFENPEGANEKLLSHARDTATRYSVRKEAAKSRKRTREAERAKKEAEKLEREQEKVRLRKLRLEDAEEKMRKIKEAAGLSGNDILAYDWSAFLTEDWDDQRWEQEMKQKFGDVYYAGRDQDTSGSEGATRKNKLRKPKWDDDIDVTDLVPDFDAEENGKLFSLSEDLDGISEDAEKSESIAPTTNGARKSRDLKREREEQKRKTRNERRKLEQIVDDNLDVELALKGATAKSSKTGRFRYRDTSPVAYGLTAHDILMASDSQLNQYAGLKKMATFRDAEKKKKDKKHLGKKARLRQWRMETFGNEKGPTKTLQDLLAEGTSKRGPDTSSMGKVIDGPEKLDVREGKKRKRSRKSKGDKATA